MKEEIVRKEGGRGRLEILRKKDRKKRNEGGKTRKRRKEGNEEKRRER